METWFKFIPSNPSSRAVYSTYARDWQDRGGNWHHFRAWSDGTYWYSRYRRGFRTEGIYTDDPIRRTDSLNESSTPKPSGRLSPLALTIAHEC